MRLEIETFELATTDTLVDIGCGTGQFDCEIASYYPNIYFVLENLPSDYGIKNIGNEVYKTFAESQKCSNLIQRFNYVEGKPDSIPLESNKYSKVLCRLTLHEFNPKQKMIDELCRIIKPNGILIIVEKNPKFKNQKGGCGYKLVNKEEIINSFKSLQLIKDSSVKYIDGSLNILQFKKT